MKLLILILVGLFLASAKNRKHLQNQMVVTPSSFDETPAFVNQDNNIHQTNQNFVDENKISSLSPMAQGVMVQRSSSNHGIDLENIDTEMEYIKSPQTIAKEKAEKVELEGDAIESKEKVPPSHPTPKILGNSKPPSNNVEDSPPKEDENLQEKTALLNQKEEARKFNRTHNLIKSTFATLEKASKNVNSRSGVLTILERIQLYNKALNLHDEELSKAIYQNYHILETIINQLLNIRETLLEMDLNNGNLVQKRQKLKRIQELKAQIGNIKEMVSLLRGMRDNVMWRDVRVLSNTFPSQIVRYFDLNNRVYHVNKVVHLDVKKPCSSLKLVKKNAYYDPTLPQTAVTFINFKQYDKLQKQQKSDNYFKKILKQCTVNDADGPEKSTRFKAQGESLFDDLIEDIQSV